MPLTDAKLRSLKAAAKQYKVSDAEGLQILIFPNSSKLWRFAYRFAGKKTARPRSTSSRPIPSATSGLTPYEYICKLWTKEPDRFTFNPLQQMPGLNI
jgi:hypothetical protein